MTLVRAALYSGLFAAALLFNGYGAPELWFSDELTSFIELMIQGGTTEPLSFAYPAGLHTYLAIGGYRLAAALSGVGEFDRVLLIYVARSLSAIFFVLSVLCAEKAIATVNGRGHDLKTVVLVGTSCALVHHAHIATVQASLFFGIALAYWALARTLVLRTGRAYYLAAAACGVAVGAKYPGIYMGIALPFAYIYAFRPGVLRFARGMALTALSAGAAVLAANPYIAVRFERFLSDVMMVALREAPHFQAAAKGISATLDLTYEFMEAFFSIPGAALVLTGIVAGAIVAAAWRESRRSDRAVMLVVIAITAAAYLMLQTAIAIPQSRYFIPLGLAAALAFSLSVDIVAAALVRRPRWLAYPAYGALTLMVVVVLGGSMASGFAHVSVFPESGKLKAQRAVEAAMTNDPSLRVVQFSYGGRTATLLDQKLCGSRCRVVALDRLAVDRPMETWDEFIDAAVSAARDFGADLILAEDIIFVWQLFIPTRLADDYSRRFDFPNPGLPSWLVKLETAGFVKSRVFERVEGLSWAYPILSKSVLRTIEGIGGDVHSFERRPLAH